MVTNMTITKLYINCYKSIKIKCKTHNEIFSQTPEAHLRGLGCSQCNKVKETHNISSKDSFIEIANKIHNNSYDYSKVIYVNNNTPIIIICKKHKEFKQTPIDHCDRGRGCFDCGGRKKLTLEEFIEKAIQKHGDKYDYAESVYINAQTYLKIKCRTCNKIFEQTPNQHLQGSGCYDCNKLKATDKLKLTKEEFVEKAIKKHGDTYNYDLVEYVNNHTNVKINCNKHGEFEQTPQNHLAGKGCTKCMKNNYSKKQIQWLEYIAKRDNIKIEHAKNIGEYQIGSYQVDGYCRETNTCFEFHGNFWHSNPRMYNLDEINPVNGKKMKDLYDATITKEKYIRDNGCNLVVIWEDEWDKMVKDLNIKLEPI